MEGPLNIQRSPQGQPVIFQAGSSDDGIALAGKYADAVFTHSPSLEETRAPRVKKNSAIAHGRSGNDVKIFPGIGPIVGPPPAGSRGQVPGDCRTGHAGGCTGVPGALRSPRLQPVRPGCTVPELGDIGSNSFRSTTDRIKQDAREKGSSLRQVALEAVSLRPKFIGTPEHVADELIRWFDAGASDGSILDSPHNAKAWTIS